MDCPHSGGSNVIIFIKVESWSILKLPEPLDNAPVTDTFPLLSAVKAVVPPGLKSILPELFDNPTM